MRLAKKLIACAVVLTVAACGNSTVIDGCRIFAPIHGSSKDTSETRAQVDNHNAKGVGACGWSS
jgi:hypothetical protein